MRKNKLSTIFAILTVICIFSIAAIADRCGCRAIPVDEKVDVEEAEEEVSPGGEEEISEDEQAEESEEESSESEESTEEEETSEQVEAPTIELEIYEGPVYSSSDNVCYYRIKANVTGSPNPDVEFSKDDSSGTWGDLKCQINIDDPADTYTLTATVTNSEGSSSDTIDLSWGCAAQNNPPMITQIVIPATDMIMSSPYDISAIAVDPDGDSLAYSWSVSGGTIDDPAVNPMVWTTPGTGGDYDITLVVDDGTGGTDTMTETVTVIPTIRMGMPIDEAGWIVKSVNVCENPSCTVAVGDVQSNDPCRGFVSFDIHYLDEATILNATLEFTNPVQTGNPYDHLIEAFWVKVVNWGDDALELGEYDLPSKSLGEYPDPSITINNSALIEAIRTALGNGRSRFQIMISHKGWQTNNNVLNDYIQYNRSDIHLIVEFY